MPAADVVRFRAAYEIEPFGERREDLRTARLLCLLAAIFRDPRRAPPKVRDFLTDWWEAPESPEEAEARLVKRLEAAFGPPLDGGEGCSG